MFLHLYDKKEQNSYFCLGRTKQQSGNFRWKPERVRLAASCSATAMIKTRFVFLQFNSTNTSHASPTGQTLVG